MVMKKLTFLLLILFSLSSIAQSKKKEKEARISQNEMPPKAIQLLDKFNEKEFKEKTYFFETDGNKKSYEAKFIYKKHAYSVEFSEDGKLQDVEKVIRKKEMPTSTQEAIEVYLEKNFDAFKLEKIQEQFKDKGKTEKTFQESLQQNETPDNYEIIVQVRKNQQYFVYEFLFDAFGNFKKKRKVDKNSYDYLIF